MSRMNKLFLVFAVIICIALSTSGIATLAYAAEGDATLSDLTIDGLTIEGFASDVFTYDLTVENAVTSVEISAAATDALAVVSGDTGTQSLTVGNNVFTVTCTSADGLATQDYTVNITREPSSNALLSSLRINGNLVEGFSNDIYSYDILVDFPVDNIEIDATPIHTGATVSGDLGIQVLYSDLNTLTITCTGEDGVTTKDYVLNITRAATSSSAFTDLGFEPAYIAMDPSANVAYMTSVSGHCLYRANLDTGNITYLTFENKAYSLAVKNQKIYLTLLHGLYPNSGVESGTIAIINISDFTVSHTFDVALDPYDIEVDANGVVFLSSGKHNVNVGKSYNSLTGDLISTDTILSRSHFEYNEQYNKIYSLYLNGTAQSLASNQIVDGAFTSSHYWPYYSEYDLYFPAVVSPDGQFFFTGKGSIFKCAPTTDGDMVYHDKIYGYDFISFDANNDVFYTVDERSDNKLLTYDYSTLTVINQFTAKYSIRRIFYNNNKLVCLQSKSYSSGYFFTFNPEESDYYNNVTDVSLSSDEINLMVGDRERLQETISPSDATNQHVLWTSSNPAVATFDNNEVFAHSAGTCEITAMTLDGGYLATCTINVSSTALVSSATTTINGLENLGFTPYDVELDPANKVAYLTAKSSGKLYRVDLVTGEVKYLKFAYNAEYLTIKDSKLYLTLGRTYYLGGQLNGKVVVVDTDTFTMSEYVELPSSPSEIAIDTQNILYLLLKESLYGIVSYDTNTWAQIEDYTYAPSYATWEYNELYNKIYLAKGGSPTDLIAYEISNGLINNLYDSPYHGDYEISGYVKISPDGKYIFNSTGNIFACQANQEGDMLYYNHIDEFTDVCFDESNNIFYTGFGKNIKEYNLSTQSFIASHIVEDEIHELHYKYGQINAIQINSLGQYYFSTITEDDYIIPYVQTAAYSGNALSNIGFVPKDIAIDAAAGMAYMTAEDDNKLYQANLATGQMQYMEFIYTAESITVGNGKVYVTLLHQTHQYSIDTENTGTVAVIAADTFTFNNHFVVEVDPYDIEVDNQGIVYIGPGSGQWDYAYSYNSITGAKLSQCGSVRYLSLLGYNPQYNKLYSITQGVSPRDITAYETLDGILTDKYNSPYHGDYPMSADLSISPDGQYIFNGSGNIFNCAPTSTGDMVYNGNIDAFTSVCYDLVNNRFFTSLDNVLKVYAYDSRSITKQYTDENDFVKLFYWVDKLIALKIDDAGEYYIDTETGTGISTTGISIEDGAVNVGQTLQLTPTVTPSDATNKTVLYSSSDDNIATVNSSGLVTGVSPGAVTITATTQDGGFTDTCIISVTQPVTGVTLLPEILELEIDATYGLTATFSPSDAANQNVTWSSSNDAIATVDINGNVTAVAIGVCDITVTTEDGGFADTCTVTIVPVHEPQKVAIIFGMADYVGTENDLPGPVNDIVALGDTLTHAGYTVYSYMDYSAVDLLATVESVASSLWPTDTLLFAYSGHGADGGYLVGSQGYGISITDLESKLSLHTGVKEVLLDACYSGDFIGKDMQTESFTTLDSQAAFNEYVISVFRESDMQINAKSMTESGYYVITASSGSQLSYEFAFNLSYSPYAVNNLTPFQYEGVNYYWMGYFSTAFEDGFGLFNSTPFSTIWADGNSDNILTWNEIYQYAVQITNETQQAQVYPTNSDHVIFTSNNVRVTGITLDDGNVDVGDTLQLTPVISPSDATNQIVYYLSSDESVATVDLNGLVTGVSLGTATITVITQDGDFTDTCTITSGTFVESVDLSPETVNISVGDTYLLTTTIAPENATNQNVTYTSSNEDVATVDAVGMIWTHTTGTATITVTTEDGGYTDTCTISVDKYVNGVSMTPDKVSMLVNDTLQLTTTVTPEDATNKTVTYSSNNEAVATVDAAGLVTSHTTGSATITVTTQDGGFEDTCDIIVADELLESDLFTVNRLQAYLEDIHIGATAQQIIDAITTSSGEIRILDGDRQPITGDMLVSTAYYVQLVVNDVVVDELCILIEGDVNPDTLLNIIDYTLVRLHILELEELTGIALEVADVNDDGIINIIDYTLIRLHILELESLY